MLTNFDLMWTHVKKLINNLMSSDENMLSDELYAQYIGSFEQLMQIIESEPDSVTTDKLEDVRLSVTDLEKAYASLQEKIQGTMQAERLKIRTRNMYKSQTLFKSDGFSKTS